MTTEELKAKLMIERADRVTFLADAFKGRDNCFVKNAAIHVLETYHSPLGALWFHCKHVATYKWIHIRSFFTFRLHLYWLRYGKMMSDEEIEEIWFPEEEEN